MSTSHQLKWILSVLLVMGGSVVTNAQTTITNSDGTVWLVLPPPGGEPSPGSQAVAVPAPSGLEPNAPPLVGTIEGINFDEDGANSGFLHIPPDPIGAAGSNHLVSVVNTSIEWHTKAGVQQNSQRLGKNSSTDVGSFFQPVGPTNNLFDPKVIYDQHSGRFVVIALERQDTSRGDAQNASRFLLAVSDDGDPNGPWYYAAFNTKLTISSTDTWGDYPGFAVDEEAVYITLNMFTFGSSPSSVASRLWIVPKSPFYSGGVATSVIYDPSTLATGTPLPGQAFTMQPAHVFGASGVPSGAGTFLVSAGWILGTGSPLTNDALSVIRVDSPVGSPTFVNQFINLGDIHTNSFPNAPQLGTSELINDNDIRALHAVWRNDNLYVVNTVNPLPGTDDAGQATAHWYRINTTTLSALTLADQGNIGGEEIAAGTYTFFPSIAVDGAGDIGIGFAASAPSIYPGAYYTGRKASDAAGTMQPAVVLAAGEDFYYRVFSGTRNRWGDYSGISVDPTNDTTFWVFNEYALTRGTPSGGDGRWGTRWGSFTFNSTPSPFNPGLGTTTNRSVTFSVVKLATDADADAMAFTVSPFSTGGGTVAVGGGGTTVTYTPAADFSGSDTFTYNVDDRRGGTTNGTVTVTVTSGLAVSLNVVSGPAIVGLNFVVRFAGIPGRTYTIERSDSATGPWTKATNLVAPITNTGFGVGVFEFSEATGGAMSRFYRTVYPSY